MKRILEMARRIPRNIERKEAATLEMQIKAIKADILAAIGDDKTQIDQMQKQLDALDSKMTERQVAGVGGVTWKGLLEADESVQRLVRDRKGTAVITLSGDSMQLMERKTTILESVVGTQATGVLQLDRDRGIVAESRQQLFIRNALASRPTALSSIDFVKVLAPMTKASPQTEGSDKGENRTTFTSVSERVKTIATWIPASRQVLDDFNELAGFIDGSLRYAVDLEEEKQILSGDNTGENLHGLTNQATAFNSALLVPSGGYNKIDYVGRAVQQIMEASELSPSFVVLHPRDWWGMRLTKDSYGRYILGDPAGPVNIQALWGLMPIITNNISATNFLVGSGSPVASELRDRMELTVEISTSHSDYFTKNLVAIRCEKRTALVVKRPASYIYGTLSTSP